MYFYIFIIVYINKNIIKYKSWKCDGWLIGSQSSSSSVVQWINGDLINKAQNMPIFTYWIGILDVDIFLIFVYIIVIILYCLCVFVLKFLGVNEADCESVKQLGRVCSPHINV